VAEPTAAVAARAEVALAVTAPDLVEAFRDHLPRATGAVSRRLLAAARREGLLAGPVARGAADDPARLLGALAGPSPAVGSVGAELTDAVVNLAVAFARYESSARDLVARAAATGARDSLDLAADRDADAQCLFFERLATEGHNLHPCARTRLGWSVADVLAYDLESPAGAVGFVAVRRDLHVGDDVGPALLPDPGVDPGRYAVTPVHAWQLERVVRRRYADLVADGALVPLDAVVPARPTAALRTLLLPALHGRPRYVKVSLDIQVTSTRRTISVASTRNGPRLSALLAELLGDPGVLLMAEVAGSATVVPDGRDRDLATILRDGLAGRLGPGELAVPGGALPAVSPVTGATVVAELVARFGRTRGLSPAAAAAAFVAEYARLVLPPLLGLATRHGIAFEAHLQNCVPVFRAGVPVRLALRDLAGLRLYPGRLAPDPGLWPGSVVRTDRLAVMRAKLGYTTVHAHLGEIVARLAESPGLDPRAAWAAVRAVVDEVYDGLGREPGLAARAAADHAFLTAPTLPYKALLSMRLADRRGEPGDRYVNGPNPLHR
jgi:siderophore synthetase component